MKCAVIGAGSWGTALAHHLASTGREVLIFAREEEVAEEINGSRRNSLYLPDMELHAMEATTDYGRLFSPYELYLWAVPVQKSRRLLQDIGSYLELGTPIVNASKGIENETLLLPHQIFADILGPHANVSTLSGPSFAREVVQGVPTAVTIASPKTRTGSGLQDIFSNTSFRAYTTKDVMGVEICAAVKNVIAIASGICHGLGLGHNATAALITRGLAEITRLVVKCGGHSQTASGLAGVGDLVLTCTGGLSRNRTVGERLARGETLGDITAGMNMVAEGVQTCQSTHELALQKGVDMPITAEVYRILFEDKDVCQGIRDLMNRDLKAEHWS
ncbi:NAD(P)-dependent glycerol-3-phosphate dehydrogenase [Desulfurispirillum indicum]|uniref:Glycerol-3-phosphate dehydrogenase [NAD(P)+] n=1 Tax=Desulfurispirillum indicum (strain ATCC BAA-1389 / DSM 22839 / S5) TaxID=653733 RepID=E6W1K0_DESIS|nr:NAD(P)H-dependent glycerol-3-phosphate dehydrogenase [Desulfurispirillum indicum]ADU66549.1 NAD-dependent glycerol-3-phosphate dehydrogenase domain protein [Desulfurispirillum indicum S5]UCZ55870.1 NAD(P)-dependent glycerol-3-phosphate dehydrogenase [Desulfurispirillum indicum]